METFHPQTIAFILAVIGLFQSADFREFVSSLARSVIPDSRTKTRRRK